MDLAFGSEHEELRRTVRAFLAATSPESEVRRLMESVRGHDQDVWARMGAQLGLQGLAIPEEYGGGGGGPVETGIVMEEMGRALLCAPYLSTCVLATRAILASGDRGAARELLPGIACGVTVATLAFSEPDRDWNAPARAAVRRSGTRLLLDGAKDLVLDGGTADLILVTAEGEAGPGLYAVPGDAGGLTRTPLSTLDPTRRLARLEFDGTPAHPVGGAGEAPRVLASALDHAAVALAAECVGGAGRMMETAVGHARERVQFGRPIGAFQAVKHACADMYVEVESARAAAQHAMWTAAGDTAALPAAAALAKSCCADAYMRVATETIQVLGGIGVTWEHPAHLYFRRAKVSQILFGDPGHHRETMVRLLAAATAPAAP
ncbi:acyl-CoA dehydrogenase family protein [Actinomadura viridis]|uniref:Alkylation response protein AidB-like acyl-CoA dehydrogenase n=1 Tax=Actinomadura viridis TaxID=58110 RepID=A0A931GQZ2_9ACTN|nr:acyl-CoA dehydrogenase family protein [Actinomadura viridis]MBG6089089.1 alkylation response protein AidB-like acyl-CoA dehydrogenase [Actinomadura viridis]